MPIITCSLEGCDNTFYREPSYIKKSHSGIFYCSLSCRSLGQKPFVECFCCKKSFRKIISRINRDGNNFCSKRCSGIIGASINLKIYNIPIYPKTKHLRIKIRIRNIERKHVETISDMYVKSLLVRHGNFCNHAEIPQDFVEAKRAIISLKRQIKNSKQNE